MKKIDKFTNLYSLQKTLRFNLIPIGRTAENFAANRLLEEDEHRAESYNKVKSYLDRYYKAYIDSVLPNVRLNGVREYAELYYASNKTDGQHKEMDESEAKMRKQISDALKSDERYGSLFKKEVLDLLCNFLTEKEEKDCVEEFKGFITYFQGFFQNRGNMFSAEAKATAIANRCISDNLPRFLDNAKNYIKIKNAIAEDLTKLDSEFVGIFGTMVDDVFSVDYFTFTLSQEGIDRYNQLIGGYTTSDGMKIQGINELVNLYNQKVSKESRIPKLKALYKQILSERTSISFIPKSFESDQAVLDAINEFYSGDSESEPFADVLEKLDNLARAFSDMDIRGLFVKNDIAITTVSKKVFGNWDAVSRGWEMEYDAVKGYKDTEKYLDTRRRAYKLIKSFSIAEINRYGNAALSDDDEKKDCISWISGEIIRLTEEVKKHYTNASPLLSAPYASEKKLSQNDDAIVLLKTLLDGIKDLEKTLGLLLGTGKEENKDDAFYGEFLPLYDGVVRIDRLYDSVRNYITKKPYSTNKIKLNFSNPQFLGGWDKNKEADCAAVMLRKGNAYYLGVMPKGNKGAFKNHPEASGNEDSYEKLIYKLLPGPNKMLPKVFFSRKGLEDFRPSNDVLRIYNSGSFKSGETFNIDECRKLIDFFKDSIAIHPDWKNFGFEFSPTQTYKNISEFYNEVSKQGYKLSFTNVPAKYIDELVEEGGLYLFRIYNKDFSEYSHGTPNLHTIYFNSLFDADNIENPVVKLNGESEMFYRRASINKNEMVVHPANNPINNKNPKNKKPQSTFGYDLIKDKRYTNDQFMIHIPITLNFSASGAQYFNESVRKALKNCENNYVIGIDRGERNLIYISVVDEQGRIAEQISLNEIINEYNGESYKTDYHKLLDEKEKERKQARVDWKTIDNIKDLKEGYISQVVHKICELVEKYDAVIAMEDLNFGFKNTRSAVEKSVYQKFEKMLIDKLNFYVNKKRDADEPGGVLNAYQLTNKFESFAKMGKQNGFIFYVPAWNTSKIDPMTGFVDLLRPKYESVVSAKSFFSKFDRIGYSSENDWFEFSFNYSDFKGGVTDHKKNWTLCTNGDRIVTFRDPANNNEFTSREIVLTKKYKELFTKFGVGLSEDMKRDILEINDAGFFKELISCLKLTLQMRNSITGTDVDYLISPVKAADGTFYCSNDYHGNDAPLPIDADANGAYNIARKAHMLIERFKATPDDELAKTSLAISNADYLKYLQQ